MYNIFMYYIVGYNHFNVNSEVSFYYSGILMKINSEILISSISKFNIILCYRLSLK